MIKNDKWIEEKAKEGMISPFESSQVRNGVISYGVSSFGYDLRISNEFKIFTNINNTVVDPKNFDSKSFIDLISDVCIVPPNSFALGRSVNISKYQETWSPYASANLHMPDAV
jgi:dCTP deaminase (EC 3.5.4.13)